MINFQALRQEIDSIDYSILNLLKRRINIVKDVKKIKDSNSSSGQDFTLYIKPYREYEIIKKVIEYDCEYPRSFLYNTWRSIIAISNFLEQNLKLLSTCTETQAKLFQHFGMQQMPNIAKNSKEALEKISSNQFHILAFKADNIEMFNLLQKQNIIKIFAAIEEGVLLCGKIEIDSITEDFYSITTEKTDRPLNKNAGVYLSQGKKTSLGGFYSL